MNPIAGFYIGSFIWGGSYGQIHHYTKLQKKKKKKKERRIKFVYIIITTMKSKGMNSQRYYTLAS